MRSQCGNSQILIPTASKAPALSGLFWFRETTPSVYSVIVNVPRCRLFLLPALPAVVWLGRWSFGLYGWGNLRSRRRLVDPGQNHPHDGSSRVLLGSTLQFYPLRRGMATESPLTLPDKHQTQMDVHPPQKMTQDRMNGFMDG